MNKYCMTCGAPTDAVVEIVDLNNISFSMCTDGLALDGYAEENKVWWCNSCRVSFSVLDEDVAKWNEQRKIQQELPNCSRCNGSIDSTRLEHNGNFSHACPDDKYGRTFNRASWIHFVNENKKKEL